MAIIIIFSYLFTLLSGAGLFLIAISLEWIALPEAIKLPLMCSAIACAGGSLYCLRSIYLNKCVKKRWDPDWHVWYAARPIASAVCGAVSYLFLKAGLLILDSTSATEASFTGFLTLSFIAGLNVDRFIQKIEEVAHAAWGISKSRSASED